MIPRWLADAMIERATRTPYFHLHHADDTFYMRRFWLREYPDGYQARVHNLVTEDYDRHLHDHPWDFVSIVLRGGYVEARPISPEPQWLRSGEERTYQVDRRAGSWAVRRATDRHRIIAVLPDTWTLFITSPKRHWWGFHTPSGKIHWQAYESVHNATPIAEAAAA